MDHYSTIRLAVQGRYLHGKRDLYLQQPRLWASPLLYHARAPCSPSSVTVLVAHQHLQMQRRCITWSCACWLLEPVQSLPGCKIYCAMNQLLTSTIFSTSSRRNGSILRFVVEISSLNCTRTYYFSCSNARQAPNCCQPQNLNKFAGCRVLQDKTDGKRCVEDAATCEATAGALRKPKRATKRRLF